MNVSEGKPSLLGWTAQRDKNTGNLIYINVHTNEARQEPPEMARGGLLADEMGKCEKEAVATGNVVFSQAEKLEE